MKKATPIKTVRPRRKYDDADKQHALQLLREGQSVPSVAQALGVSEGLLYRWKHALRPAALEQELGQLWHKLKQVESIETTQIYQEANLAMKEEILAKTTPVEGKIGRYRPDDQLLAFLKSL
jgi:transposase-like protein